MKRWDPNDLPECLVGYTGQFDSSHWFRCLCEHFSANFPVKTHRRYLKPYQDCFVAKDAVTWLVQEIAKPLFKAQLTRENVTGILRMMHKDNNLFEDVRGEAYNTELFSDNSRLFRFKKNENNSQRADEITIPNIASLLKLRNSPDGACHSTGDDSCNNISIGNVLTVNRSTGNSNILELEPSKHLRESNCNENSNCAARPTEETLTINGTDISSLPTEKSVKEKLLSDCSEFDKLYNLEEKTPSLPNLGPTFLQITPTKMTLGAHSDAIDFLENHPNFHNQNSTVRRGVNLSRLTPNSKSFRNPFSKSIDVSNIECKNNKKQDSASNHFDRENGRPVDRQNILVDLLPVNNLSNTTAPAKTSFRDALNVSAAKERKSFRKPAKRSFFTNKSLDTSIKTDKGTMQGHDQASRSRSVCSEQRDGRLSDGSSELVNFYEALNMASKDDHHLVLKRNKKNTTSLNNFKIGKENMGSKKESSSAINDCGVVDRRSVEMSEKLLSANINEGFCSYQDDLSKETYKLVLAAKLCRLLQVSSIWKLVPPQHIDPSVVNFNYTRSDRTGLVPAGVRKTCKDFPQDVRNTLHLLGSWPIQSYCKNNSSKKKCHQSVQNCFDRLLSYLESNLDVLFPSFFYPLLVAVYDHCSSNKDQSDCQIPVKTKNLQNRGQRSFFPDILGDKASDVSESDNEDSKKNYLNANVITEEDKLQKHFDSASTDLAMHSLTSGPCSSKRSHTMNQTTPRPVTLPYVPPVKIPRTNFRGDLTSKSVDKNGDDLHLYDVFRDEYLCSLSPVSISSRECVDESSSLHQISCIANVSSVMANAADYTNFEDNLSCGIIKKRPTYRKVTQSPSLEHLRREGKFHSKPTRRQPEGGSFLTNKSDEHLFRSRNDSASGNDGADSFYCESAELAAIPGWRSKCSVLVTGKKRHGDLVIANSAAGNARVPRWLLFSANSSTISTPVSNHQNIDASPECGVFINSHLDAESIDKRKLVGALRFCLVLLDHSMRRNFYHLFGALHRMISNKAVVSGNIRSKREMITEAIVDVFTGSLESSDLFVPAYTSIFNVFIENYREILDIPDLESSERADVLLKYMKPVAFCKRVTVSEYEKQAMVDTKNALVQLLKGITEDTTTPVKVKRAQLKKFEKAYPDIYYEFFPPTAVQDESKDQKSVTGDLVFNSWRKLLKNFR